MASIGLYVSSADAGAKTSLETLPAVRGKPWSHRGIGEKFLTLLPSENTQPLLSHSHHPVALDYSGGWTKHL